MMKEEVLARDFDLGFSGNSEDVVMHVYSCWEIVSQSPTPARTMSFLLPSTTIPSVFELNFYSNGVLRLIMEAIIGVVRPERIFGKSSGQKHVMVSTSVWMTVPGFRECVAIVWF